MFESGPIALPFAQDREPGEPSLRSLQREELEQVTIVVRREAPLLVVIGEIQSVLLRCPVTAARHVASLRRGLIGIKCSPLPVDPDIRFPGESDDYRRERDRLLEA